MQAPRLGGHGAGSQERALAGPVTASTASSEFQEDSRYLCQGGNGDIVPVFSLRLQLVCPEGWLCHQKKEDF